MKKILILFLVFYSACESHAQYWRFRTIEIGGGIGTTQFYGDVGGFTRGKNMLGLKDFSFHQTRYNITVNGRYRVRSDVSARLNFSFGQLHATDARGSNEARGYESTIFFFEPTALGEFYFLRNLGENSYLTVRGKAKSLRNILTYFDAYAFTGFGINSYSIDPNEKLKSRVTRPSGITPVIPIGVGVNLLYSRDLNIGLELGGRYVFTDNLEGYTSSFSERNDMYVFFNATAIYKLRRR